MTTTESTTTNAAAGGPSTGFRVAVIGAGVIGTSVAFACLLAGHSVTLVDRPGHDWTVVRAALRRELRRSRLSRSLPPGVDLDRITFSDNLADVAGSRFVVENVSEDWSVKRAVYARLRSVDLSAAHIAANTSAIPIDRLAKQAEDESRVIGIHFMNPVAAIDVVEIVRGPSTADETLLAAELFLSGLGKRGIVVNDAPGFVINRILMVMVNEAARLVDEGVASAQQIDELFKGCLGHAMGPLRTADLIGLDTIVNTLAVLRDERVEPTVWPADGLTGLVRTGLLGIKTGRGFYDYGTEQ